MTRRKQKKIHQSCFRPVPFNEPNGYILAMLLWQGIGAEAHVDHLSDATWRFPFWFPLKPKRTGGNPPKRYTHTHPVAFCSPARSLTFSGLIGKPISWQKVQVLTSKQHAPKHTPCRAVGVKGESKLQIQQLEFISRWMAQAKTTRGQVASLGFSAGVGCLLLTGGQPISTFHALHNAHALVDVGSGAKT